ncbi:hypothetical protein R4P47_08175 [Rhodococcus sp. IEGM 1370]|uniref:hypothetical protein n=1 Tax=Rhodococcus sp. IEGM 1370 TaxID=3082222 RepID=UPI002955440E|nr:hypothetical protein [Rhodococcus sp. IEGM 1370]MDV8076531.1 hypothetical protein [Rhodococcus sp. IEGM 1370]
MAMKISVALDQMTFGDLYNFVDLARGARIGSEQAVNQVVYPQTDEDAVYGLELELDSSPIRTAPDMSGIARDHVVAVLESVIESDGDARGALEELRELRDLLA